MGWLDRFTRRWNLTREPDMVWATRAARMAGLQRLTTTLAAQGPVLVVAHFANRAAELAAASGEQAPWRALESEARLADLVSGFRSECAAGSASVGLLRAAVSRVRSSAAGQPLRVLAVERHPLRARDVELEQVLESLPLRVTLQFHLSLDDALLVRFAGERLTRLMSSLGMREDEAIDASLLTRAVASAQKKLARSVRSEIDAASAEAWLRANVTPE